MYSLRCVKVSVCAWVGCALPLPQLLPQLLCDLGIPELCDRILAYYPSFLHCECELTAWTLLIRSDHSLIYDDDPMILRRTDDVRRLVLRFVLRHTQMTSGALYCALYSSMARSCLC